MQIRDALQLLGLLERGELAAEFTRELDRVVQATRDAAGPKRAAKGSLTLKLDVEIQGVSVTIVGDVNGKTPKTSRESTMYFVNAAGEITTDHPQQMDFFPRDAGSRDAG